MIDEPLFQPEGRPSPDEVARTSDQSPAAVAPPVQAGTSVPPVSEAVVKFRSCRWRRPPDEGVECCGHRDVLPIAGTASFDAEAWCPDCAYFKLRRVPKKREYY